MASITDTLITEHAVLAGVFEHIERVLPKVRTLSEAKMLASLIAAVLHRHSETETHLAFVALDHALDQRGELDRLHQDHEEIDARLSRIQMAADCAEARRLLKATLRGSREHFAREEQTVFPLIERVLSPEALTALGSARVGRGLAQALASRPAPSKV